MSKTGIPSGAHHKLVQLYILASRQKNKDYAYINMVPVFARQLVDEEGRCQNIMVVLEVGIEKLSHQTNA